MSSREDYNWTNEAKNLNEGLPPNTQRSEQPTPEGEKVEGFSQDEMKKVQDDIDSVNAGAVVDKTKLLGFPCDINELCDVLQNTCQLLNGIKPDAVEEKWWSDWDESVLESLVKLLRQVQPFYKK